MPEVPYTGIPGSVDAAIPGAYEQGGATPASFGGQIGESLQRGGNTLEHAGDQLFGAALRQQEIQNQVDNDAKLNDLQDFVLKKQFGDPNDPTNQTGYFGMEGQAAKDARAPTEQAILAYREQLRQGMSPRALAMFDNSSRRYIASARSQIASHYAQESKTAAIAVNIATQDLQEKNVGLNFTDDRIFFDSMADAENAAVKKGELTNADPVIVQADIAKRRDALATARVLGWASHGQPEAGLTWALKNSDLFSPEHLESIVTHLEPKVIASESRAIANSVYPVDGSAPTAPPPSRPDLPPGTQGSFVDKAIRVESGGNPSVVNPASGAAGLGQFIPSTWLDQVKRHAPEVAQGKSDDQLLAMRTDSSPAGIAFQKRMLGTLSDDNRDALAARGLPVDDGTLYLAHFQGVGGAEAIVRADPSTPVSKLLSPAAIAANPTIANMTAGQIRQWAASKMDGAGAPQSAAATYASSAPDMDRMAAQIRAMHLRPEVEERAISQVSQRVNQWNQAHKGEQDRVESQYRDNIAALQLGHEEDPDLRAHIAAVFPAAEAAEKNANLDGSGDIGEARKVVDTMGPEEIQAKADEIQASLGAPGAEGYRQKALLATAFGEAVRARDKAIKDDPNAFVLQHNVSVQAAYAGIRNGDPATVEAYMRASLAAQDQAGVPLAERSALTADQAKGLVAKVVGAPAPQRGTMLRGMEQTYGQMWPEVMGSMIRQGKLPGEYQVLGMIDDPVKQQALSMAIGDGKDTIKKAVNATKIDTAIEDDGGLAVLAASMPFDPNAFANIKAGVKALAYGLSYGGQSDSDAAKNAIAAVTSDKYDFTSGGYRIPKGRWDIRAEADRQVTELDASHLAPADPFALPEAVRTPEYIARYTADNARNGYWVNNENDTGLIRMGANHNQVWLKTPVPGKVARWEIPFGWAYQPGPTVPSHFSPAAAAVPLSFGIGEQLE